MTLELRCSIQLLLVATEYLKCGKSELRVQKLGGQKGYK